MCDSINPLKLLGAIPEALGMGGESKAGKKHVQQFGEAARSLDDYRQEVRPVGMQGLRQGMSAYQPAMGMLEQMYGPSATFDIEQILQDPRAQVLPEIEQKQETTRQEIDRDLFEKSTKGLPKGMRDELRKKYFKGRE